MGPKKKKEPVLIEGVDTTEMTFQKLQQYTLKLYERLLKEREERNYFQMERDKLRTFWELTTHNLDEARAKVTNQDHDLELADERRVRELRWVNQKVKFLEYEQNLKMNEMAIKEKNSLLQAEKDFAEEENELLHDKKDLKIQLKDLSDQHQQEIKYLKIELAETLTNIRKDMENQVDSMDFIYEKKITDTVNFLDTKQRMEMSEVEERKNLHIRNLMEDHDEAFNEMRNYFNNIMLNNFSLIMELKEIIEDMKSKEARKNKSVKELTKENAYLKEALRKDKEESNILRRQVESLKKSLAGLKATQRKLRDANLELERIKCDYDVLSMRYENYKTNRTKDDELKILEESRILKSDAEKFCLLKLKLDALEDEVEQKNGILNQLVRIISTLTSQTTIGNDPLHDYKEIVTKIQECLIQFTN